MKIEPDVSKNECITKAKTNALDHQPIDCIKGLCIECRLWSTEINIYALFFIHVRETLFVYDFEICLQSENRINLLIQSQLRQKL